jgi:A/G-specific adenine glycosylase
MPDDAVSLAPVAASDWHALSGEVRHVFTHFELRLRILAGTSADPESGGIWILPDRLSDHALPTLMKKVAALARQSAVEG